MAEKEVDIEKEVERLARKSNINIRKSEYSFEKQLSRLDKEIDKLSDAKLKNFDNNKKATQDYLEFDISHDTVNRYREKLKKI